MGKVVIIGNGIAGVTAARHIRKNSDKEILIISAESEHFFSRTALMYVYMGHMRCQDIKPYEDWFWKKNRIDLLLDYVQQINTQEKSLTLKSNGSVNYDQLIIATGSKPNMFNWPGVDLKGVQGLYSLQDLELLEENSENARSAVVVGGGLIGVEFAEMLLSRGISVHYLVRESEFGGSYLPNEQATLISEHVKTHHVNLHLSTELKSIQDNGKGRVSAVLTDKDQKINCDIVGICVGVSPNIPFLKESGIETDKGVLVNRYCETNVKDVYAIGDCAQFREPVQGRRPIEAVWYTGRIMGETVAQSICGNPLEYQPGFWFNSAKFFDIEYQTYGSVQSTVNENQQSFHWKDTSGQKSLYVVWDKNTNEFVGINVLGLRMRHELFEHWLRQKATIQTVIQELAQANFDPEFYKRHEKEIVEQFNQTTGFNVQLSPTTWWRKILSRSA